MNEKIKKASLQFSNWALNVGETFGYTHRNLLNYPLLSKLRRICQEPINIDILPCSAKGVKTFALLPSQLNIILLGLPTPFVGSC